jgi:hypothetical protein
VSIGIASYDYQHNPFWLLFLAEGTGLLGASLGLRGARVRSVEEPQRAADKTVWAKLG